MALEEEIHFIISVLTLNVIGASEIILTTRNSSLDKIIISFIWKNRRDLS